jgi:hypothetical protein
MNHHLPFGGIMYGRKLSTSAFFTLTFALILLLAGCASRNDVQVTTTFDPLAVFPVNGTFQWDDESNRLPENPRLNTSVDMDTLIRTAANEQFAAHGYHLIESGKPDYLLSYDFSVYSWIAADNSRSIGTVSLWLAEAATGHRVWVGYGRAEVHVGLTREERQVRMSGAVAKMLNGFPPTQRGDKK